MKLISSGIRPWILKKMVRHRWWDGKHTAFDDIPKGAPKEQRKKIKKEVKKLIREGLIVPKKTGYGLHVSLNVKKKAEIEKIVFE